MASAKKELIGKRLVENLEEVMARFQARYDKGMISELSEQVAQHEVWNLVEQYDVDTRG